MPDANPYTDPDHFVILEGAPPGSDVRYTITQEVPKPDGNLFTYSTPEIRLPIRFIRLERWHDKSGRAELVRIVINVWGPKP